MLFGHIAIPYIISNFIQVPFWFLLLVHNLPNIDTKVKGLEHGGGDAHDFFRHRRFCRVRPIWRGVSGWGSRSPAVALPGGPADTRQRL